MSAAGRGGPPPNTTIARHALRRVTVRARVGAILGMLLLAAAGCRGGSEGGSYEGPFADRVNDIVPKLERGVGLPFKQPPKIELRSREQVRAYLEQQFRESGAARDLAGQEVAYKRLGAIPDTLDVRRFFIDLLTEQIVGYYDPKTDALYVVEGLPEEAVAITLTHELVHALQDQYLNLDSLRAIEGDNDRALAFGALTEGQATFEQIRVLTPGANMAGMWDRAREAIRQQSESFPLMAQAPVFIQETLVFPYLSGAEFVNRHQRLRPDASLFDSLPQSSEQILHERKFFGEGRDAPTSVTLPSLRATKVYENNLGEFETRLWLFSLLRDQNLALSAAAGWDGDRYAVIDLPQGEGIVWLTVWDTPIDAAEFHDAARRAAERRYGGRATAEGIVTGGGRTVAVTPAEVGGRPVVLWVDVPQGAPTNVLDVARVTLQER